MRERSNTTPKPAGLNARRSTLGARVSGPRAGRRFDADNGVTTEALVFLGDLDPEAIGENLAHATHYEPTPVGDFAALLAHVPFALQSATFVDIGSGMGRALLLAAQYPFRQIVGIEISPALHEIACENVAKVRSAPLACRDIRPVRADAARYTFPRGALVVYLYNPFDGEVLAVVIERLTRRLAREVALIYHTPVERATIEAHPDFELIGEESCGVVYRLSAKSGGAPRSSPS